MKHDIVISPEMITTALSAWLASKGHRNIQIEATDGQLMAHTQHVARQSFGDSVPATFLWPVDCFIQCGDSGVVIGAGEGDSYRTAFWEAFPRNPDTFLRGEGATVQEAEQKCFEHYQRILACPGHEFERGKYQNGAGICKHCRLFLSGVFEPTDAWKKREEETRQRFQSLGEPASKA
jgi:hypothetical protein